MWGLGETLAASDQRSGASPDRVELHRSPVTPPEERTAPDSFLTWGALSFGRRLGSGRGPDAPAVRLLRMDESVLVLSA